MALKTIAATVVAAVALLAGVANGQSVSGEFAQTGGYSSGGNGAAATQARIFGDAAFGVRFNLESAWATRSGAESDAFGAAYPYGGRVQFIEAYGDRMFRPGGALVAIRAGRFRTPFGIYSGSDHAYSGFLRAPLIRYDDYFALSNNFLENGVSVVAGVPRLYAEVTVGTPGDVGEAVRPSGVDRVVRLQGSYRSVIVGASHISTRPYQSPRFAHGPATFTGIDARWMMSGIEVRGEWITGQPFDGTHTDGGYLDLRVHRPALGPVTAVLRAEKLGYDASPPFALYAHRYTAGGRVRLFNHWSAQVNMIWQGEVPEQSRSAVDVALTYVLRLDSRRAR
jgi:hypothetical protein